MFLSDGSLALMPTASKGKTGKKKIKGEEGKLVMIKSFTEHCLMFL